MLRILTMLILPGMLLGCGRVLTVYSSDPPEGLDLSALGLTAEQLETLGTRYAMPFYGAAAVAMFLFAMAFSIFCGDRPVWTMICCIVVYVVLEAGTLAYLYRLVRSE